MTVTISPFLQLSLKMFQQKQGINKNALMQTYVVGTTRILILVQLCPSNV